MASFTCSHCYKATEYKFDKPKFCASCGRNVIDGFKVEASTPSRRQPSYPDRYQEDYYEEEERYENPPPRRRGIRHIEATIENIPERNHGFKLLDAAAIGGEYRKPSEESAEEALRDYKESSQRAKLNEE